MVQIFNWRRACYRIHGHTRRLMINYPYPSIAKFSDLVQLKDYRPPTKKEYVRYLRRFADHLQRDPAGATEDDRDTGALAALAG